MYSPERHCGGANRRAQGGAILVELLVGLSVGALAIGAAIASLMIARDAAGAVSDMNQLQQQAAYAMRVLGLQVRAAGSLALQEEPDEGAATRFRFVNAELGLGGGATVVHGEDGDAHDSLTLANLAPPLLPSQRRDCLGQRIEAGRRMDATFLVDAKGNLKCRSSSGQNQPLVSGVAAFRVRYRARSGDTVRSLRAAEVDQNGLWPAVTALEICLDLQGQGRASAYAGRYVDCSGRTADSGGRLHLVSHKLLRLRTREGV